MNILGKEASQSSMHRLYDASFAVDGLENTRSATQQLTQATAWWMVNLELVACVTGIKVFNNKALNAAGISGLSS